MILASYKKGAETRATAARAWRDPARAREAGHNLDQCAGLLVQVGIGARIGGPFQTRSIVLGQGDRLPSDYMGLGHAGLTLLPGQRLAPGPDRAPRAGAAQLSGPPTPTRNFAGPLDQGCPPNAPGKN